MSVFKKYDYSSLSILTDFRNLMLGENTSGCWATVGVLTEKGQTKVSSNGKNFSVWKLGTLDELIVSVFLFGDAYSKNSHEPVGTIFALINSSVRKDTGVSVLYCIPSG